MITPINNQQPTAQRVYSIKHKYVAEIRRYLQHKQTLSQVSPYYKRGPVAHCLALCNTAFTNVVNDAGAYSLTRICELVLLNKQNLHGILPVEKNPSYPTSLQRLNAIINYANQFLNTKPV